MGIVKRQRYVVAFAVIMIISLICFSYVTHAEESSFAGGKGTVENPYLIETAEQLDNIRADLTAHYELIADIDLSDYENWEPIGSKNEPFQGVFNGENHTISHLTIQRGQEENTGLFGYVQSSLEKTAKIEHIQLEDVLVNGGENTGGLIGHVDGKLYENKDGKMVYPNPTIINNIKIAGQVYQGKTSVGGRDGTGLFIGRATNAYVSNVEASGFVKGTYRLGGLIGIAPDVTTIVNSSFSGDVLGTQTPIGGLVGWLGSHVIVTGSYSEGVVLGNGDVGGLAGYMTSGSVTGSYSTSYVEAERSLAGGLIGRFDWNTSDMLTIRNSFATGDVKGVSGVGGLIGNTYHLSKPIIENTFATGNVTGNSNSTGGLIGMLDNGRIKNSYALGKVTSDKEMTPGGLAGATGNNPAVSSSYYNRETTEQTDEGKGEPLSDAAMKEKSTFSEWDFDGIWQIDPHSNYPYPTFKNIAHTPEFGYVNDTIYVREGALGKGHSWDSPLGNLEIALKMAERNSNIKEIWVAEGTYLPIRPTIASNGNTLTRNQFRHFKMVSGVTIYGGFPATGDPTFQDRNSEMYETTLSGSLYGENQHTEHVTEAYATHVFYHKEENEVDKTAVLDGVTIANGKAISRSAGNNYGGGMYNENASPTLRNVIFKDNYATYGGGLYNIGDSKPVLENAKFQDNIAAYGGGMYNDVGQPILSGVIFEGNEAPTNGGAIYNKDKLYLDHIIFKNNTATYGGGGLYNDGGKVTIQNTMFNNNIAETGAGIRSSRNINRSGDSYIEIQNALFANNIADRFGSAMYIVDNGNYNFSNITVTHNTTIDTKSGANIYLNESSNGSPDTSIHNSIVWDDDSSSIDVKNGVNPTISHSLIGSSGGSENWDDSYGIDGGNNLDENPLFVGNGDYTLQANSPAIDTGNNNYIFPGVTTDLAGNDRIINDTVDMGAYEFYGEPQEEVKLESISVKPGQITLHLDEGDHPFDVESEYDLEDIEVTAHYSDGSTKRVTNNLFPGIADSSIASFDNGKIVAQSVGKTELFINYDNNSATVDIEVVTSPTLKEIEIASMAELYLNVNDRLALSNYAHTIVAIYDNVSEVEKQRILEVDELSFESNNLDVVKVENGEIVAVYPGETEIVVSYEGKEATIDVTVANHLFFEEDELEIEVGDSAELELVLWTPEGEENVAAHAVRYNSHNSDIATVDGEGKVTGKKLGVANIAVTVKEDLTLTAKLEVQVTKSERVDSSGAEIAVEDVSIILGEGAVEEEVVIKVKAASEADKTEREPEMTGQEFASSVYRLTKTKPDESDPGDSNELSYFEQPITLTFNFDHKRFREDNSDVAIYWYDEINREWVMLKETDINWENGKVSGVVDHFTLFTVLATVTVDKTYLTEIMDEAQRILEDAQKYTDSSVENLASAISEAETVLEKEEPSQDAINSALESLKDAIKSLVEKADKAELYNVINEAESYLEKDYTAITWSYFATALSTAREVLENEEVEQIAVDEALETLQTAIEYLVMVDDSGEEPKDPEDPPIVIPDPDEDDDPIAPEPRELEVELDEMYEVNAGDTVIIRVDASQTTIIMPEDLPAESKITVQAAKDKSEVIESADLVVAGDVFDIFVVDSNGNKVMSSFKLTMSYNSAAYGKDEVAIYYYDETEQIWIEQEESLTDVEAGTITVQVPHFSMYGVFAMKEETKPKEDKKDDEKDKTVTVEEDEDSDETGAEETDKKELPKTATNTFNFIVIGSLLLILGAVTFIFVRRKA